MSSPAIPSPSTPGGMEQTHLGNVHSQHISSMVRFKIQQKGEIIDRISDLAGKSVFTPAEQKILRDSLLSSKVMVSTSKEMQKEILNTFAQALEKEAYSSEDIDARVASLNQILSEVSSFKVNFSEDKEYTESSLKEIHQRLPRYLKSETIPAYIAEFDVSAKHTMNPLAYLDVRLSRKMGQMIKFASRLKEAHTEVFLGPTEDMKKNYEMEGYKEIAYLGMNSSYRVYYFENPNDAADSKVVITGILNNSRLNNLMLILKFSEINLDKVKIRGTMSYSAK